MSKFTKALNKIQEEKSKEAPGEPVVKKNGSVFEAAAKNTAQEGPSYWERGIPEIKNILPDARVVAQRFPNTLVSEQYRMLRTSLKNHIREENAKVILVSSSIHSEGKTVTTANLGSILAENGDARVLLIDADLRRGKLGEYLGFGGKRAGLSNFLAGDITPKEVMYRNSRENLIVIPRGGLLKNPSELISSSKFQILIQELRKHFDYVLIDSPPIMSVADAGILARVVDGVLMIIQIGRTPKNVIAHSNLLFKQSGVNMLGYILTNVEGPGGKYGYYNNYYYGDNAESGGLREKTKFHLMRHANGLKTWEDKFNTWWDRNILKKGKQENARRSAGENVRLG